MEGGIAQVAKEDELWEASAKATRRFVLVHSRSPLHMRIAGNGVAKTVKDRSSDGRRSRGGRIGPCGGIQPNCLRLMDVQSQRHGVCRSEGLV